MMCDKSPTGRLSGKSSEASIIAKKIHHPAMLVTNVNAPPAYITHTRNQMLALCSHLQYSFLEQNCGTRTIVVDARGGGGTCFYEIEGFFCRDQIGWVLVCEGEIPVGGCEAGEAADEGEEDDEEDDVGAE